jgi:hypothetical protein
MAVTASGFNLLFYRDLNRAVPEDWVSGLIWIGPLNKVEQPAIAGVPIPMPRTFRTVVHRYANRHAASRLISVVRLAIANGSNAVTSRPTQGGSTTVCTSS